MNSISSVEFFLNSKIYTLTQVCILEQGLKEFISSSTLITKLHIL